MFSRTLILCVLSATALLAATLPDAAQNGDQAQVRALLQQKVNVNATQGDGTTALHWAAFNDDLDLAKLLIDAGAKVNAATRNGAITPLLMACRNGSAPMIELLLKSGADVNSATLTGTTALMMAASSGSADAVKALVDHGANVNAKDFAHGQTALMFAASLNRADAIKMLMAHGADAALISMVTKVEKVRFDRRRQYRAARHARKTASLREKAAPTVKIVPAKTEESETPAEGAKPAAGGKPTAAQQQNRGDRGATTMGGHTALLYAARDGQIDAARALLDGGANVNEVGEEKTTPIVMAIMNGHLDLAKLQLDRGADPNLANVWGLSALYATIDVQWAPYAWFPQPLTTRERVTYLDLMKALLAHGADPNAKLGKETLGSFFRGSLVGRSRWRDALLARRAIGRRRGYAPSRRGRSRSENCNHCRRHGAHGCRRAGLGGQHNSTTVPDSWLAAVQYCLDLGLDVNSVDTKGYTALHGVAFRGDNDLIKFLVGKGAKVDAKAKEGETVADMANGPIKHSILYPETVALLEKLGSTNSHNCRSDQCIVSSEEKRQGAGRPGKTITLKTTRSPRTRRSQVRTKRTP